MSNGFNAPPIKGYRDVSGSKQDAVNANKEMEEQCLRMLDALEASGSVDACWLAIGRTRMEEAWMAVNRSIFQPKRVALPGD